MKKYISAICVFIFSALLAGCLPAADKPVPLALNAGETVSIAADGAVYSSEDPSIASVDSEGRVTAVGEGSTTVTAALEDRTDIYTVSVSFPDIERIMFCCNTLLLNVGNTDTAGILTFPETAEPAAFTFSSSDERIAAVDEHGNITARGMGTATITAAVSGMENISCTLEVTAACDAAEDVYFDTPYITLTAEETAAPALRTVPYGADALGVCWSSSKESVASVSDDGIITAHKRGSAVITAAIGDTTAEYFVTVAKRPAAAPLSDIPAPRFVKNAEGVLTGGSGTEGEAHIMLIGDLMCLSAQQGAVRKNGVYDFNSTFSIVKDIFEKSDFAVGNLETLISHSNSYSGEKKEVNGNPNCNGPATYLDAVRYGGLDAVVLANNHSGDGGISGIYDTLSQIDKYGLARTGVFGSEREERFLITEINGIKVGIASYTGHVNSGARTVPAEKRNVLLNFYTPEKAEADIAAMKEAGAEYIIVYMHWGTENTHRVNGSQRAQALELADMGADFIAGSHPHCLQHAEILTAADGREVTCVYSMGNFVSSMGRTINNDTVIISLRLARKDGAIHADAGYIGCRVIGTYNNGKYVVVPVSPALNGGDESASLAGAGRRINKVMGDAIPEIREF